MRVWFLVLLFFRASTGDVFVGPLVDKYCWETLDKIALDTGKSLSNRPLRHTVHCLVEEIACRSSGFVIVHKPDGADEYETLVELDDAGNVEAIALIESEVPPGSARFRETGFSINVSGTVLLDEITLHVDTGTMTRFNPSSSTRTTVAILFPIFLFFYK